jgi:hypothetical protein
MSVELHVVVTMLMVQYVTMMACMSLETMTAVLLVEINIDVVASGSLRLSSSFRWLKFESNVPRQGLKPFSVGDLEGLILRSGFGIVRSGFWIVWSVFGIVRSGLE